MKRALKRYYVVDQFHVIVALLLVVNRSRSMLRFVLRLQVFHSEESSTGEGLIASSSKNRWITRAQRVLDLTFLDARATTSRFLHVSRCPAVDREITRYHWPYVVTNVRSNSPGGSETQRTVARLTGDCWYFQDFFDYDSFLYDVFLWWTWWRREPFERKNLITLIGERISRRVLRGNVVFLGTMCKLPILCLPRLDPVLLYVRRAVANSKHTASGFLTVRISSTQQGQCIKYSKNNESLVGFCV